MIGTFITGMLAGCLVGFIICLVVWFINLQRKRNRPYGG